MKVSCVSTALLLAVVVLKCIAYKTSFGKCARIDSQPNFSIQTMLGNWYVIAATSTSKRCLTYFLNGKFGHPETFLLTETFAPSDTAKFFGSNDDVHRTGILKMFDKNNPAVMSYKMPHESQSYKLAVLSTDYDHYALIYVCKNMGLWLHRWSATLLSRTPGVELSLINEVRSKLRMFDIELSSLSQINHAYCDKKPSRKPTLDETLEMIFKNRVSKVRNNTSLLNKPELTAGGFKEMVPLPTIAKAVEPQVNNKMKLMNYVFTPL